MKKVFIGIAALGLLVFGGVVFVWSNIDSIVKDAIETYGSEATKTTISVANVSISLENGEASISGLHVGNPAGFSEPNIFQLGMISTRIDTSTVTENPIVIDEIIIKSPEVFYEINQSGVSNADVLKKNVGGSSSSSAKKESTAGGEEMKMIIRKLVVEGGKAKVVIAALGGKEQTVTLPRIKLTDVGKKSGGATALEVAQILSNAMLKNIKSSVAKAGVGQYLGKSADAFKKGALEKGVGGIGTGADDVGGALKGMLGK